MEKTKILFVCLGNICRSPLAEAMLRHFISQAAEGLDIIVDSAGTGGWHQGEPPDRRSIRLAERFGLDISGRRARKVEARDFHDFDLIFAMDRNNLRALSRLSPSEGRAELHLFMDFATGQPRDVPDPYHGEEADFDPVYESMPYAMLLDGCGRVLERLAPTERSKSGKTSSVT